MSKVKKTYWVEVTGTVEVTASFEVSAPSKEEAMKRAEEMFLAGLECSVDDATEVSTVESADLGIDAEEAWGE